MSQPITLTLARKAPRPLRWLGVVLLLGLLSMPFLALLPQSHPLAVSTWLLTLSGKILCYAIVAVALDLVWGYAGLLSLGHGLFFGGIGAKLGIRRTLFAQDGTYRHAHGGEVVVVARLPGALVLQVEVRVV